MKIKIIQDKGSHYIDKVFLNDKDVTNRLININIDSGYKNPTKVVLEFYPTELELETESEEDKSKFKGYAIQEISTSKYIGHNGYITKDIEEATIWYHREDEEEELANNYNTNWFRVVGVDI